jgi:hypothetical protein
MYLGIAVASFISAGVFYCLFRKMGDGTTEVEEDQSGKAGEGKVDDDDEEDP